MAGRSTESCATVGPQDFQQPLGVQNKPDTVPLAARIRQAWGHAGEAREIAASRADTSAPSAKCQGTCRSEKGPIPAKPTASKQSAPPPTKPPATKTDAQLPSNSAVSKKSEQRPPKPPATKSDAQPDSVVQTTSSMQSRPKQGARRLRSVADDDSMPPAKQRKQGKTASSARGATHKRPHIDLAAPAGSTKPAMVDATGEATMAKTTKPAAVQPMPWGSPKPAVAQPMPWGTPLHQEKEFSTVSQPPHRENNASAREYEQQQADVCRKQHIEKAPAPTPSGLPQQSATNLLEQWMVQEEPGGTGSLLNAWCALASAEAALESTPQPEKSNTVADVIVGDEPGAAGAASQLPGEDASERTKQSAKGAMHAPESAPAQPRGAAQKRRFQPTGRSAKKPSIHLSVESCVPSTSAVDSANVQLPDPPTGAARQSVGNQATQATAAPAVPPVDALLAGKDAPSGQHDDQLSDVHDFDAVLQQPDAATLNIMLQHIAKRGADGSSTAQISTTLLRSMAQCMDKLLQQSNREEPSTAAVRNEHGAPEHNAGQDAQCHDAQQSTSVEQGLKTEHGAAQLCSEQPAQGAQRCPDAGAQLPDVSPSVTTTPVCKVPAADEPVCTSRCSPTPSAACHAQQPASDGGGQGVDGAKQAANSNAEAAQVQCNSTACPQQESPAVDSVQGSSAAPMERQRNIEVEEMEWARRQSELEKQRRAVQAERRVRAEQNAVVRARAQRQKEQSDMEQRAAVRGDLQGELGRVVLPGMSLRQALFALGFHPGPGADGERAGLKQARVFHHPDSSRRRGDTLRQQIMSEEIFKILGSLV